MKIVRVVSVCLVAASLTANAVLFARKIKSNRRNKDLLIKLNTTLEVIEQLELEEQRIKNQHEELMSPLTFFTEGSGLNYAYNLLPEYDPLSLKSR